jgi:KipI family sensor histidine kinase inhibitor
MNRSVPVGAVRLLGDAALLIGVEDATAGRVLARELAHVLEGCDIVGGLATVMVSLASGVEELDPVRQGVEEVLRAVCDWPGESEMAPPVREVVNVVCVFDGPDLAEVAEMAGCTTQEVIGMMTAQPLTVDVVGFSPGFAYLGGLPGPLGEIPRRGRPRPSVPPGSVALANGHAAIYPTASPGGWQLIGRTGDPMFSLSAPPYARLAPGDRVHFTVAAESDIAEPHPLVATPWDVPESARLVFEVTQPGLRTLLQDEGRRGVADIGVPWAGPGDPVSFSLANRLVGNPRGASALEVTARGPTLRCVAPGYVAVVGGSPDIHLQGQPVAAWQVLPVKRGQVLDIGRVRAGFRAYLAVAGGFVGPTLFGSVSSDQLSGLGPGPLSAGESLYAGEWAPPLGDHVGADAVGALEEGGTIVLRVVPGPHEEWFAPEALKILAAGKWTVEDESNRVGLRLRPQGGSETLRLGAGSGPELDSQGTVTGAIQVPPGGDLVILMPDHATLGGYPVVAVVATVDQGRLGQCAPGTTVTMIPIDHEQARQALVLQRRSMAAAVLGHYPLAVD